MMCKSWITMLIVLGVVLTGSVCFAAPWMGNMLISDSNVWTSGRSGNYGTVKYFIDENASETVGLLVQVEVWADGNPSGSVQTQFWSNLNRRDYAKHYEPVADADTTNSYYVSYPATYVGNAGNNYVYQANLVISKCGAYRLTARFRINSGAWQWHNDFYYNNVKQRDAAVVVSPRKVLSLDIYEADVLNVEATASDTGSRSTFEDFTNHDTDGYDPFNLRHVADTLGFNAIWLMPVHPIGDSEWVPTGNFLEQNGSLKNNREPGSPYATEDYWSVNEWMSDGNDTQKSLNELLYVMDNAETFGLNVFFDIAMNHSNWSCILGRGAVNLNYTDSANQYKEARIHHAGWLTRGSSWVAPTSYNYRQPAPNGSSAATWAPGDQMPRHQWYDAGTDWFFGDYCTLGLGDWNASAYNDGIGGYKDERDEFWTWTDGSSQSVKDDVERVWKYLAQYVPYWLRVTNNKLDGIRADFAQGLPPQAWEFIINKTRQVKWDFVFLAEVLDDNQVRYRANRHFDLIGTVSHSTFRDSNVTMTNLRDAFEAESDLMGYNAAVMWNGTSHDEDPGTVDAWTMMARYAVCASAYGVPGIWQGQPLALYTKLDFPKWSNMKTNWDVSNDTDRNKMYKRINDARDTAPALRASNRYFLNKKVGGGFRSDIFASAKWQNKTADTNNSIVFVFVNLRDNTSTADETYDVPGSVPLLGSNAKYQAYNLVASDPNLALWPSSKTSTQIYTDGIFVGFDYANEVQYVQLRVVGN